VIPNGVDADYFQVSSQVEQDSRTLVFLGRMDYFPNVAGILDFAEKVFPLVRQRVPDARLKIVGSNPVAKIRALEKIEGISVTGFVPDVRPHVAGAAVAIAPLSIARGTQNKVLECMAMGIPVVASVQVAKGVQAEVGRHLLAGADPQDFAAQVVRLLEDARLRKSMAEAARQQVISAHSWPESMNLLDKIIAEQCGSEQPASRAALNLVNAV
jgi:glycosyltransferase involved in cell wall biosynthesis